MRYVLSIPTQIYCASCGFSLMIEAIYKFHRTVMCTNPDCKEQHKRYLIKASKVKAIKLGMPS